MISRGHVSRQLAVVARYVDRDLVIESRTEMEKIPSTSVILAIQVALKSTDSLNASQADSNR